MTLFIIGVLFHVAFGIWGLIESKTTIEDVEEALRELGYEQS